MLKAALVNAFGWSLFDIDNTDLESLMPFVEQVIKNTEKGRQSKNVKGAYKRVYCDDPAVTSWL